MSTYTVGAVLARANYAPMESQGDHLQPVAFMVAYAHASLNHPTFSITSYLKYCWFPRSAW